MQVEVNGKPVNIRSADLAAMMAELGHDPQTHATAHNGHFVARDCRASVTLAEGDRIEVLRPMYGG